MNNGYFRPVINIGTLVLVGCLVVNSLSLSIQFTYQKYFCQDTKSYMSIAGRTITVCGKTCDYKLLQSQENETNNSFTYNFDVPPLFIEQIEKHQLYNPILKVPPVHIAVSYSFTIVKKIQKPPTCLG